MERNNIEGFRATLKIGRDFASSQFGYFFKVYHLSGFDAIPPGTSSGIPGPVGSAIDRTLDILGVLDRVYSEMQSGG